MLGIKRCCKAVTYTDDADSNRETPVYEVFRDRVNWASGLRTRAGEGNAMRLRLELHKPINALQGCKSYENICICNVLNRVSALST